MRIALYQSAPRFGDVAYNIQQATETLEAHGEAMKSVDLLVLPELAFTGTDGPPGPLPVTLCI
jgi:predicted amidohydrolase